VIRTSPGQPIGHGCYPSATCPSGKYLSPPQIARQLGVKPAKILGFIARGELRAIDVSEHRGKRPRWKVSHEALAAFLAVRESRQAAPATSRHRPRKQETVIQFF
jgi:hypothetical protein